MGCHYDNILKLLCYVRFQNAEKVCRVEPTIITDRVLYYITRHGGHARLFKHDSGTGNRIEGFQGCTATVLIVTVILGTVSLVSYVTALLNLIHGFVTANSGERVSITKPLQN